MTIVRDTRTGGGGAAKQFASGFLLRVATPMTVALFLISSVSGVALFFHWTPGLFHSMHEWLSVALLAPVAILHVYKNWRPLVGYARRGAFYLPLALSLAVAAPFAVAGWNGAGVPPGIRSAHLLTATRLGDLAPVLKTTPDDLAKALGRQGAAPKSLDDTLDDIATASGKSAADLLVSVLPPR